VNCHLNSPGRAIGELPIAEQEMTALPSAIELGQGGGPPYRPSVSVVVPALNEQATLQHAVEWTISVLREISDDYEVVIVDDGSTDQTGRIADGLAVKSPHVRVIHNPRPSGYGGALDAGFKAASKEVIGLITADEEFHPTDLPRFVEAIRDSDIVTSVCPHRPMPLYRKFLSWGWRTCVAIILGERPVIEGTFMIRRKLFNSLQMESRSGMYVMEMLIKAARRGARIKVIAIGVYPRPDLSKSKVGNLRTTIAVFNEILALRRRL
jgi:glycosyltransferase involved in cell wall biosynthesis